MKNVIVDQLKSRVGLTEEQATKAAEVVIEIVEAKTGGITDKLGDAVGGLGGLFGGDKK